MLTPVHNDVNNTDDADDYNRVIGIAQLRAFSCAKKETRITHGKCRYMSKTLDPMEAPKFHLIQSTQSQLDENFSSMSQIVAKNHVWCA